MFGDRKRDYVYTTAGLLTGLYVGGEIAKAALGIPSDGSPLLMNVAKDVLDKIPSQTLDAGGGLIILSGVIGTPVGYKILNKVENAAKNTCNRIKNFKIR
jgi:hypothetical protein